jgi:hypothetical protein
VTALGLVGILVGLVLSYHYFDVYLAKDRKTKKQHLIGAGLVKLVAKHLPLKILC